MAAVPEVPSYQLAPLPEGWIAVKDEGSGEFFYVNEKATPPESKPSS